MSELPDDLAALLDQIGQAGAGGFPLPNPAVTYLARHLERRRLVAVSREIVPVATCTKGGDFWLNPHFARTATLLPDGHRWLAGREQRVAQKRRRGGRRMRQLPLLGGDS